MAEEKYKNLGYLNVIQRKLIDEYGFREDPDKPGIPLDVPDGDYPMTIHGQYDRVHIKDGFMHCTNTEEGVNACGCPMPDTSDT